MSKYDKLRQQVAATDPKPKRNYSGIKEAVSKINPDLRYDNVFETYEKRSHDVDFTNQDYLSGYENPLVQNLEELRAQRQPWAHKAGRGVARVGAKVATEIAKMPGVLGGVVNAMSAPEGQGWETAFNNEWIKAVNQMGEHVNSEFLPVYVKKAIKDGNLMDNLLSMDFWATEGADGIGYIASMLAPGALINRAKIGEKLFSGLGKAGVMSNKLDDAAQVLKKIGVTPTNVDTGTAALANTLFEAGAEAQGAGDAYIAELEHKLATGVITKEQYEEGLNRKAEVMRNVFATNMLVLMGPNVIMHKMIWGKGASKSLGELSKQGTKATLKNLGDDFLKAGAREGFFEEGMQSTAEGYFVDKALEAEGEDEGVFSDLGGFIGDLPEAYASMVTEVDGQKAIALGWLLGGGMQSYTGYKNNKKQAKRASELISKLPGMESFVVGLHEGVNNEDGSLNPVKLKEKLAGLSNIEHLSAIYDQAVKDGDTDVINTIRAHAAGEKAMPFLFDGEMGLEALEEHLNASKELQDVAQREGKELSQIVEPIMERAKKLQNDVEVFKEFAPSFLSMENEKATEQDKRMYYDAMAREYTSKRNMLYFTQQLKGEKMEQRRKVLESAGLDPNLVIDDEVAKQAAKDNFALARINEEVSEYDKAEEFLKQEVNDFWKESTHKEQFDSYVGNREKIEQAFNEENVKKVSEANKAIENATSEEELDSIQMTGTEADKALKKAIKKKRKEIQEAEAKRAAEEAERQARETKEKKEAEAARKAMAEDTGNYIAENYNPGENIPLTKEVAEAAGIGLENIDNTIIIESADDITDDAVKAKVVETGETITIPRGKVNPTPNPETDTDTNTEGGENHDGLIPQNNENRNKYNEGGGTPVLTIRREDGVKPDFVSDDAVEFERNPIDKRGQEVGFEVNMNKMNNNKWTLAQKLYQRLLNGEKLTEDEVEHLIDHLPINAVLAEGVTAPILTQYKSNGTTETFDKSTRVLRQNIANALLSGVKIEDIFTTIEGQYNGQIKVDPTVNGKAAVNNVFDLHYITNLPENEQLEYIQNNLGAVNKVGDIMLVGGGTYALNKPEAKGEIYLMIPTANGTKFPLKLNISKIQEKDALLLADLYAIRLNDASINKTTTIAEIQDEELKRNVKQNFQEAMNLIDKPYKDITVKDLIDFIIWDGTNSPKTQVRFTGTGVKGQSVFVYGNPQDGGRQVATPEEFDAQHFVDWLMTTKRYNITLKPRGQNDNRATLASSQPYIKYMLNNKYINTNAVVGKSNPTFQGYAGLYLDSNNLKYPDAPETGSTTQETVELDSSPWSKEKDGDNMYHEWTGGKEYMISAKSGRVFVVDTSKVSFSKPLDHKTMIKEVVTDNAIIDALEQIIRSDDMMGDPNISLNRYNPNPAKANGINIGKYLIGSKTPKEALQNFKKLLTDELGLPDGDISFANNTITYGGVIEIEASITTMGGGNVIINTTPELIKAGIEKSVKNNGQNIRKSQKKVVPLHKQSNTKQSKKVKKTINAATDTSEINATPEAVKELTKRVLKARLLKVGSQAYKDVMAAKTNQEKFNKLKEVADANQLAIDDIITKCN